MNELMNEYISIRSNSFKFLVFMVPEYLKIEQYIYIFGSQFKYYIYMILKAQIVKYYYCIM